MSLIPLKPVLDYAKKNKIAHGAFNVNMVCQAEAIVQIHETFRSAAIIQGADLANAFMGGNPDFQHGSIDDKKVGAKRIADAVKALSAKTDIPIVLHLDHGRSIEVVKAAIDAGYSSVMIDGSSLPYDENIELTREAVKLAHQVGVTVEGELGILSGFEDSDFSGTSNYTNPVTVCDFFKRTGVDCLAISYGTMHGAVKGRDVKLRKEIVIAIMENLRHENIDGTLVSHGSSTVPDYVVSEINQLGGKLDNAAGIPLNELLEAISYGISKINIDTDIRLAVTRNIRELFLRDPQIRKHFSAVWDIMENKPEMFDPRVYLSPIMLPLITGIFGQDKNEEILLEIIKRGVMEAVGTLIIKFGSYGDAYKIQAPSLEQMADFYKQKGI